MCPYFVNYVLPPDEILYNDYIHALPKEHPVKVIKGEVTSETPSYAIYV
jgi:hypothetical protein